MSPEDLFRSDRLQRAAEELDRELGTLFVHPELLDNEVVEFVVGRGNGRPVPYGDPWGGPDSGGNESVLPWP